LQGDLCVTGVHVSLRPFASLMVNSAKQSRFLITNEMQIASVVFDSLAMTIAGLMQRPLLCGIRKKAGVSGKTPASKLRILVASDKLLHFELGPKLGDVVLRLGVGGLGL
jgi:hypothetical protein